MVQQERENRELLVLLTAVVDTLINMPPTASGWDVVPDFVVKIQREVAAHERQLASLRLQEAEELAALKAQTDFLCQKAGQRLAFFGFRGCDTTIKFDDLSAGAVHSAQTKVENLVQALDRYEQTVTDAQVSIAAKRRLNTTIRDQESLVLELVQDLQVVLGIEAHKSDEAEEMEAETAVAVEAPDVAEDIEGDIELADEAGGREFENVLETAVAVEAPDVTENIEGDIELADEASGLETAVAVESPDVAEDIEGDIELAEGIDEEEIIEVEQTVRIPKTVEDGLIEIPAALEGTTKADEKVDLSEEEWRKFFWQLVSEGDVAGAYWVNRSLDQQEEPIIMPVPDWLVAAVQGAWWLSTTRGSLVQGMSEVASEKTVGDTPNERFMAISAALLPAVIVPSTGLGTWLETDNRLPEEFNEIVTAVKEFNFNGRALRRHDVRVIRGEDQRQQTLDILQKQAIKWLDEAPQRRAPSIKRASDVWYAWTKPGGKLRKMLEIVANNKTAKTEQLKRLLTAWRDQTPVEWIDQTDAQNTKRKRSRNRIDGRPRNWLINQSEDCVQLAEEWLDLVTGGDDKAGWYLEQVETLLNKIETSKDAAFQHLETLQESASGEIAAATIRLLKWALKDLCLYLELDLPDAFLDNRQLPSYPQSVDQDLPSGLQYRLYWIPEANVSDEIDLPPENLAQIATFIYNTQAQRTLAEAFKIYIRKQDYRFIQIILQNDPSIDEMQYRHALNQSNQTMKQMFQETADAIEQAVVEGVLDDDGRARFESELIDVEKKLDMQNFGHLLARLNTIQQNIEEGRAHHLDRQQERWSNIQLRLQNSPLIPDTFNVIAKHMEDIFQKRNIIVTDERLARLEEILDSGAVPAKDEFETKPARDVYQEFVDSLGYWEANFNQLNLQQIARNISIGHYNRLLDFDYTLPRPREIEVSDAFKKWYGLKTTKPSDIKAIRENISPILRYLDFTLLHKSLERAIKKKDSGPDWIYLSVEMSSGNLSPVPQFGSQQAHGFDVICLWERPGAQVIGSRLHNLKLSFNNVIVFYLGRLTKRHRIRLQHYTREQGLSLAVIDELLLLFLARETESRLRSFFQCALPLARVNPYAETGPVYPEMFVGRVEERKSLQESSGYALVYGGRQLGKSALLQQVEREFHNPVNDQYVYREDIKFIGDPLNHQNDPDQIWDILRRGLEKLGLLAQSSASKPETIINQIKDMMDQNRRRRVLILFDEADNFLDADMTRSFEIVSKLKTLMDDTKRRFKVVFAGLHKVQRYEGIPNQPFAQLPDLQVRPLDPQSALLLIRQPLEALGFRFPENDDTPLLGILAYTNYHPGLVQLFCQKLLNNMYQERSRDIGPFIITRDHVEAIYRQRDVREGIRRRFEWTLALDERYKALTQLMVLDQIEAKNGFSKAYSLDELLVIARLYLPQAFENNERVVFRGYLDEMTGLGVLVQNQEGEYRLRSPNLVRLMGSEDDLWGSLSELAGKNISTTLVEDSQHAPLDQKASRYSPFTYQQSRVLNAKRFGVNLVFGSQALNLEYVGNAFEEHFIPAGGSGKVRQARLASEAGAAFAQWLKDFLAQNSDNERLIVYRYIKGTPETIAEQVEAAISFCARKRSQRQWMRIMLIFDSVATNQWLYLPSRSRMKLEEQVDVAVMLRPWDSTGITQRLLQQDKIGSEQTVQKIKDAICGWPMLIDLLADRWGRSNDPLPSCSVLQKELLDNTEMSNRFLTATGWDIDEKTKQFIRIVSAEEKGFPIETLVPAFLGDNLTRDECAAITEYCLRMNLIHIKEMDVFVNSLLKQLMPVQ